ncbi:hypothetical protein BKA70DRAFT_1574784 [Coprinopsis sp. MPI-PUGE-AT-0042]|nr:hypothetical protein BKA70DRAFT_1574784 [Coprinopsis sp. MPI-PUGE-AT-0042]
MDNNSTLLPETVYQVVKLVEGSQWEPHNISTFLQSCALVSKEWNAMTRPLILESVSVTCMELAGERIAALHEILDLDPSYAGRVRRLKLAIHDSGEGMDSLKECGESLLALVNRLTGLTHLLLDPSGEAAWLCMSAQWFSALPLVVQELFTTICALPSLQALDLRGLELPTSLFVHHPALQHLTLAYGHQWKQYGTSLTSPFSEGLAPLKSFTIHLHGVMDKSEVVDSIHANTLRGILHNDPQLFRSLTSFDALSLVENIRDIRTVLQSTRNTLQHFACGLTWQRLRGVEYDPFHPPPSSAIEDELKLDFSSMLNLTSIELRYDSPSGIGFLPTSPVILATLKTIRWTTLKKLKLILFAVCPDIPQHLNWKINYHCTPIDHFLALHTVASPSSENLNKLDDIELWISHTCSDGCNSTRRKYGEGARKAFFPLLAQQARCCSQIRLRCHVWWNGWAPEHEAYLIGGWKLNEEDERCCGIFN